MDQIVRVAVIDIATLVRVTRPQLPPAPPAIDTTGELVREGRAVAVWIPGRAP